MNIDDFRNNLLAEPEEYNFAEQKESFIVFSKRWETEWEISIEAIEKNDWHKFLNIFKGGKDVEQITRVTGYYAKVSMFNAGKKQELRDRYIGGKV